MSAGALLGLALGAAAVWARAERGAIARLEGAADPAAAGELLGAARLSLREGHAVEAERALKSCIERSDDPRCHRLLGSLLALEGRPSAREHLRRAAATATLTVDREALDAAIKALERP